MGDVQNRANAMLTRAKDIVQTVTWIVNEDLARAEYVRDKRPGSFSGAGAVVNDQIRRLAGADIAASAWVGEWQSFSAAHFEALDREAPVLASDLSNITGAVVRAAQFTRGAVGWVRVTQSGFLATAGSELVNVTQDFGGALDRFFTGGPGGGPSGISKFVTAVVVGIGVAVAVALVVRKR